jgi:hypothetical protein
MGTANFSDDFKRDAVAQITERVRNSAKSIQEGRLVSMMVVAYRPA